MKDYIIMGSLDKIDRKILKLLQEEGRLTNAELAQKVNLASATCYRRTQRLIAEDYIQGFRALINTEKVDRGTLVMVGVVLDRSTPESFEAFERAIKKLSFVIDCSLVAGDFDYFLKIRVKDIKDFNKLHAEKLIAFPGVRQIRSFFAMKEVTDNAPLDF